IFLKCGCSSAIAFFTFSPPVPYLSGVAGNTDVVRGSSDFEITGASACQSALFGSDNHHTQ
ncbi:TPA: hypothetical protein ACNZ7B_005133, partial [Klebsiella quasipneumoniae subsp. similipneumoniae]|uniref:hypothetical protein n=1 Tax=Klebsiella grimontii TaxID=2058152 RepID=UPI001CCDF67B